MSIFEFVKSAGKVVSGGVAAAAGAVKEDQEAKALASIQEKIKASKIGHKDLALKFSAEHTVKVYAVVESADDKADLILLVGNTAGVEKVEDAIKVRPPGATADVATPAPKFYTVKSGDTLGSISKSQLGDEARYKEIFNANRHLLSNPDAIDVGQTLRIPG